MDAETLDLVRQLCTRAGAAMEDASVLALVWHDGELSVSSRLDQLEHAALQVSALISAAKVLATTGD
jgi:hypothetical protein